MRVLSPLALLLLAIVGSAVFWSLGHNIGLPLLLAAISFAVVGAGNRLLWLAVLPLVCALIAAAGYGLFTLLPEHPDGPRTYMLLLSLTVAPALVLAAAVGFKAARRPLQTDASPQPSSRQTP